MLLLLNEFAKHKGLWRVFWPGRNESLRQTSHEQCLITSNCKLLYNK